MLNGLDLFTGIGGISLSLREWVLPIAYCEIDPYCQAVLLSRMATGDLAHAPIWDDVKTLRIRPQEVDIDIIYGGFPCQDISVAGNGKGLAGERSGLFFEIMRLAKEIKPKFIFLENVPAITTRGGLQVVREITEMGYDCRWCVISAASVGALHKRERWFLLAHSNDNGHIASKTGGCSRKNTSSGELNKQTQEHWETKRTDSLSGDVADTLCERLEEQWNGKECSKSKVSRSSHDDTNTYPNAWKNECPVDRMADGVSNRVERIKSLGNAVVPYQAREAFQILMGLK